MFIERCLAVNELCSLAESSFRPSRATRVWSSNFNSANEPDRKNSAGRKPRRSREKEAKERQEKALGGL